MTTTTPQLGRVGAQSRFARLSDQIRSVRARTGFGGSDTWMLIVGGTLMPLGVLLILLGWLGAAHTPLPFEQTPYLISGGILGLGFVISGGFVYFGYWQTIRIRESREASRELTEALGRLESLLAGGAAVGGSSGSGSGVAGNGFVATPSGSIFHRPDCPVVAGRRDLSRVDAAKTKLDACRICEPLADSSG